MSEKEVTAQLEKMEDAERYLINLFLMMFPCLNCIP